MLKHPIGRALRGSARRQRTTWKTSADARRRTQQPRTDTTLVYAAEWEYLSIPVQTSCNMEGSGLVCLRWKWRCLRNFHLQDINDFLGSSLADASISPKQGMGAVFCFFWCIHIHTHHTPHQHCTTHRQQRTPTHTARTHLNGQHRYLKTIFRCIMGTCSPNQAWAKAHALWPSGQVRALRAESANWTSDHCHCHCQKGSNSNWCGRFSIKRMDTSRAAWDQAPRKHGRNIHGWGLGTSSASAWIF